MAKTVRKERRRSPSKRLYQNARLMSITLSPSPSQRAREQFATMSVGLRAAFFTFLPFYLFTFMGGEGAICTWTEVKKELAQQFEEQ